LRAINGSSRRRRTMKARRPPGRPVRKEATMERRWYVIANAARARILESVGATAAFDTVADLVHAQGRQQRAELAPDAPGHAPGPVRGGPGGTDYAPRTDPHERERERFAREIADAIERGVAERRPAALVLVASDPFLGALRASLGPAAAALVVHTVHHDYTTLAEPELAQRLRAATSPR
jgi:protein required for attachment to host cells